MLTTLSAAALIGIDAMKVTVEINVAAGLPSFIVVGLPDSAIRESRERILTAIRNSGFRTKPKKVTINLAPADIKKEGTAFDLPIAMGLLGSLELLNADFADTLIMGELALDGTVRRINGGLAGRDHGRKRGNPQAHPSPPERRRGSRSYCRSWFRSTGLRRRHSPRRHRDNQRLTWPSTRES